MDRSEVRALQEQLEAQQEQFERLEAEMAELREGRRIAERPGRSEAATRIAELDDERSSRRDLLRKAGMAAGGAVALAGAAALPAAAQGSDRAVSTITWISDPSERAYDSRPGRPPHGVQKGKLGNTEIRDIQIGGFGGVVGFEVACIINVTAVETNNEGFFGCFEQGIPFPGTSTLNWSTTGDIIANSTVVKMNSSNGQIAVRCSGSAHLIVDVQGSFDP